MWNTEQVNVCWEKKCYLYSYVAQKNNNILNNLHAITIILVLTLNITDYFINLTDYIQVLKHWWYTWCGSCFQNLPALHEAYRNPRNQLTLICLSHCLGSSLSMGPFTTVTHTNKWPVHKTQRPSPPLSAFQPHFTSPVTSSDPSFLLFSLCFPVMG